MSLPRSRRKSKSMSSGTLPYEPKKACDAIVIGQSQLAICPAGDVGRTARGNSSGPQTGD